MVKTRFGPKGLKIFEAEIKAVNAIKKDKSLTDAQK